MSALPTLFVHMGAGKAGSTALQHFLINNHAVLLQEGYYFLDEQCMCNKAAWPDQVLFFERMLPINSTALANFRARMMATQQQLLAQNLKGAFISAENLISPNNYQYLFSYIQDLFEIKVICYLRNQVDFLRAAWKQWSFKTDPSLESWLDQQLGYLGNWNQYLLPWEAALGTETIRVRPYIKERFKGGSLYIDFLTTFELESIIPKLDTSPKVSNQSISDRACLAISQLSYLYKNRHDVALTDLLAKYAPIALYSDDKNHLFNLDLMEHIAQIYYQDNLALCQRHFPGESIESIFPYNPAPFYPLSQEEIQNAALQLWGEFIFNYVSSLETRLKAIEK